MNGYKDISGLIHEITAPALTGNYGDNINDVFTKINQNFQIILSSEFLKGKPGENIYSKNVAIADDMLEEIKAAIIAAYHGGDEDIAGIGMFDMLEGSYITMIYETDGATDETGEPIIRYVSSLPMVFIDARFANIGSTEPELYEGLVDHSCIVVYDEGFKAITGSLPTLYYNRSSDSFCWRIHGSDTGLIANGPAGKDGKDGKCYVVEAENIDDQSDIIYKVTAVFEEDGKIDADTIPSEVKMNMNGSAAIVYAQNSTGSFDMYTSVMTLSDDDLLVRCDPEYSITSVFNNMNIYNIFNNFGTPGNLPGLYVPIHRGVDSQPTSAHLIRSAETDVDKNGTLMFTTINDVKSQWDDSRRYEGYCNVRFDGYNNISYIKDKTSITHEPISPAPINPPSDQSATYKRFLDKVHNLIIKYGYADRLSDGMIVEPSCNLSIVKCADSSDKIFYYKIAGWVLFDDSNGNLVPNASANIMCDIVYISTICKISLNDNLSWSNITYGYQNGSGKNCTYLKGAIFDSLTGSYTEYQKNKN